MGLFSKKKKVDYAAKAHEIERNIWELENKQILYLDKLKGVVAKQAEYKEQAARETDKNMQRHFASLYLNAEKEKEQYAYSINEISKEIVSNAKMAQLVDTQALFLELEKMESLSLEQINVMSESITDSREKRETMTALRNEAIDKALYHSKTAVGSAVAADELLSRWESESREEEERKAAGQTAVEKAEAEQPALSAMEEEARETEERERLQVRTQPEETEGDYGDEEEFLRSPSALEE